MTLFNQHWIGMDGQSVTGRVPTKVAVSDGQVLNARQAGAVNHAYKLFCDAVAVSANPDGFHVQNRTLGDGTTVRMESNLGVHRVWVSPPGGGASMHDIHPAIIYATDQAPLGASPDGAGGWTPATQFLADRLGSWWSNPPAPKKGAATKAASAAHGKTAGYDAANLGASHPGDMDWYRCSNPADALYGYVLSWWSPYPGRYTRMGGDLYALTTGSAGFNKYQTLGSHTFATQAAEYRSGELSAQAVQTLWINGVPLVAAAGGAILGACIYTNTGTHFLRVLTGTGITSATFDGNWSVPSTTTLSCHEVPIQPEKHTSSDTPALLTLDSGTLKWSVASAKTPVQPMHCNSSGTKAVYLSNDGSGHHFQEIDLSSGALTTVATPWTQRPYAEDKVTAYVGPESYVFENQYIYYVRNTLAAYVPKTETRNASFTQYQRYVLGADYNQDVLKYLYVELTSSYSDVLNCSRTVTTTSTGGSNYNQTYSDTSSWTRTTGGSFTVRNQDFAAVDSGSCTLADARSYSGSGSTVYSNVTNQSWTHNGSGTLTGTITRTGDLGSTAFNLGMAGDLRVDSFDIVVASDNSAAAQASFSASYSVVGTLTVNPSTGSTISDTVVRTAPPSPGPYTNTPNRQYERRTTYIGGVQVAQVTSTVSESTASPSDNTAVATTGEMYAASVALSVPLTGISISNMARAVPAQFEYSGSTTMTLPGTTSRSLFKTFFMNLAPSNQILWSRYLGTTSTFDRRGYYRSLLEWPSTGLNSIGTADVSLFVPKAILYRLDNQQPAVDFNAGSVNPFPGSLKAATGAVFCGPVKQKDGRFKEPPNYIVPKETP